MIGRRNLAIGAAAATVLVVVIVIPAVLIPKTKERDADRAKNSLEFQETFSPSTSASPTNSPAPSLPPSVSAAPSFVPSDMPSDVPSFLPSELPSNIPSDLPSTVPSTSPSDKPSDFPSMVPSGRPSFFPSVSPTKSPSYEPTLYPTPIPPTPPFPSDFNFNLRMHWKREYFWQETTRRFNYCMECASCNKLTTSDEGIGCRSNRDCDEGDHLWVKNCGGGNAVFNALNFPGYDMIKIEDKDLCLTRVRNKFLVLKKCDMNAVEQRWEKITKDEPFDLRNPTRNPDNCVTQGHHPKSEEVFSMQDCMSKAYAHATALWDARED